MIISNNDKFIRPLSIYHKYTVNKDGSENNRNLRCLAACHGHNYSSKLLSMVKGDCFWYMIDSDKNCYPDYICDVSNEIDMSIFPDNYFDVIMTVFFPIGVKDNKNKYSLLLENIKRIVKPTGKIYLTELPHLSYVLLNDNEYLDLYNLINENLDEDDINDIKLELMNKFPKRQITQKMLYSEIMFAKNIKHDIKNIMNEKAMIFTLEYLILHGLFFIEMKQWYIIVRK